MTAMLERWEDGISFAVFVFPSNRILSVVVDFILPMSNQKTSGRNRYWSQKCPKETLVQYTAIASSGFLVERLPALGRTS